MWNIRIIENWDDIWAESFIDKWLKVMDESPDAHVFFHPAIVRAWIETYRPLRKLEPLFIIANHTESEAEIIFPLVRWHQNWKNAFRKLIVPMGYSDFDYHDPICSSVLSNKDWGLFFEKLFPLLKEYDRIEIDGLHSQYIPKSIQTDIIEACPFISIKAYKHIDEYLEQINKNVRKVYLRRKRNLEIELTIEYCVYDSDRDLEEVKKILPTMLKIHSERWPKAYKAPNFHLNLLQYGLKSQVVKLYIIKTSTNYFSFQLAFQYKNKLYLYMPTFNPEYMKYSPGIQSLCFCIKDAIENQLDEIDQLRGSEAYKKDWSTGSSDVSNVFIENRSSLSVLKSKMIALKKTQFNKTN